MLLYLACSVGSVFVGQLLVVFHLLVAKGLKSYDFRTDDDVTD